MTLKFTTKIISSTLNEAYRRSELNGPNRVANFLAKNLLDMLDLIYASGSSRVQIFTQVSPDMRDTQFLKVAWTLEHLPESYENDARYMAEWIGGLK